MSQPTKLSLYLAPPPHVRSPPSGVVSDVRRCVEDDGLEDERVLDQSVLRLVEALDESWMMVNDD